ncbi:hypothetical protein [Paenochrobactrum pullorum]|uniref:hypothetical protein n=1 Tax=Paenochrobactrum pullorum TaxID=1324351 RepID=UPI0035BC05CF
MGKFKQGDRVKALVDGIDYKIGDEFVLTDDGEGGYVYFDDNAGDDRMRPQEEFELLPVAEATGTATIEEVSDNNPPFKVGDRVRALISSGLGFIKQGSIHTVTEVTGDDIKFRKEDGTLDRWAADCFELAPATLTIEAGKYYRTRDGRKVGPMENVGLYWDAPDVDDSCYENGRQWQCEDTVHDLIAEWVDEPTEVVQDTNDNTPPVAEWRDAETRRFKVGDKVRALVDYCWVKEGTEYIVNFIDCDGDVWLKNVDGKDAYMTDSELELITPVEETQRLTSADGHTVFKFDKGTLTMSTSEFDAPTVPTVTKGRLVKTPRGYGYELARYDKWSWVDTGNNQPTIVSTDKLLAAA